MRRTPIGNRIRGHHPHAVRRRLTTASAAAPHPRTGASWPPETPSWPPPETPSSPRETATSPRGPQPPSAWSHEACHRPGVGARIARTITAAVGVLAAVLASSPAASAASPPITRQAAAANAAFLAYAPPPAGGAKALCLVDTGVNATPDTTPSLVSATALDGETGADVDPLLHGTIDAAVAGGAGHGVLGAWPQLKIVSIRATDNPDPGRFPSYQWDDYTAGILNCAQPYAGADIAAIVIPLSSTIPPTPDQVDEFNNAVTRAQTHGISLLSAAGNEPGPVQLPGSQPGILPVGAGDTAAGGICPFSASAGLTFFSPGCMIDQIDANDDPFCCGNGTSQASAFAAGVLVAMRSYAPTLAATQAVKMLVSNTHNGHLDATAAFKAAGLA